MHLAMMRTSTRSASQQISSRCQQAVSSIKASQQISSRCQQALSSIKHTAPQILRKHSQRTNITPKYFRPFCSSQLQVTHPSDNLYQSLQSASPFFLIVGTNVIESLDEVKLLSEKIVEATQPSRLNGMRIPVIFKASWDKANRTSVDGYRGVGLEKGLEALHWVKNQYSIPIVTDVHETHQVDAVASVCDMIQIPSFLCRQTDLLLAAGASGRIVHIKKGQFANTTVMHAAAEKVASTGNNQVLLCERGTSWGPNDLFFDPRNLVLLQDSGYPVVMDVTHACQRTASSGVYHSSGSRRMVPVVARAAASVGVDGIFIECHRDVENAPVDGDLQWPVDKLSDLICELMDIALASKGRG